MLNALKNRLRILFVPSFSAIAALIAPPSSASGQEWSSFVVDTLDGFSFTHNHAADGRFVFGMNGAVSVQDDFELTSFTAVDNTNGRTFDPSFLAISPANAGLIGGGGFFGPSGLFPFDPSTPATPIADALATLQNYTAAYWQHPSSGRKGWLLTGGNGTSGGNNVTFISDDGLVSGSVTENLSAFSGGLAVDANGDVYVGLADFNAAIDNQLLVFTAAQIDAAVDAILQSSPAPIAKAAASNPFQSNASGTIAVDALGRVWFGGYQIDHLQAWDPGTGVTRRFFPDHAPLQNAGGVPSYAPRAFSEGGTDYVSFLANDSFYTTGSDIALGFRPVSELEVRSIQFTTATGAAREDTGTFEVTVTITPPPSETVTVPLLISGTATPGNDFTAPTEVVFGNGDAQQTVTLNLIDDTDAKEGLETIVVTLGQPAPTSEAGLGALGTETFTLNLDDNETAPEISLTQNFGSVQVGSEFNYQVATSGGGDVDRWSARGLPPGLRIDPQTGLISGSPTRDGEFDRVVITAVNAFGRTTSAVFLLVVDAVPEMATGRFFGLADRDAPETGGLGARVDVTVNDRARYSGRVCIGRRKIPVRGALDTSGVNPTLDLVFRHEGNFVALDLEIDASTGEVSGGFSGGGSFSGWRASENDSRDGRCHFFLAVPGGPAPEVPEGTGFGIIRFTPRDQVRIVGSAADGSRFSSGGRIGPNGEIVLYQPLYRPQGTLFGELQVADELPQTVTGDLTWSKPEQPRGKLYREGWTTPLDLQAGGGKFRPVDGSTLPLNVARGEDPNALLVVQDGGVDTFGSNPVTHDVEIRTARRAVLDAPHKLNINPRTGAFRGVVVLDSGTARQRIVARGLLIPDASTADPFDSVGHGFFLLPVDRTETRSGLVTLEPAP